MSIDKVTQQPMIIPASQGIFPITEEDVKKYLVKIPRQNIETIFWGSDSWSIHVLKALEDNFDVKAVVTAPDSPVANYFKGPVLTPDKLDFDFLNSLSRAKSRDQFSILNSQLFVVASYGKIIPKSILDIPKYGALNVHPSLLPKYRGPSPVPETILNGDKITGVTIIKMDEKMDHGPIITTKEISLSGQEDFPTLINLLFREGARLLVEIIPDYIAERIKPVGQNNAKAVYCPMIKKEDGYFDLPAGRQVLAPQFLEKLDRMIRAYYPWPGVWIRWRDKIIKFLPNPRHSEFISESQKTGIPKQAAHGEPRLRRVRDDDKFLIQMEGKKPVSWKDFLNGYPDFPLKNSLYT